jgi:hypothetical protein
MLSELHLPVPDGCLSDLSLDEWLAGELDADRERAAAAHAASCERCAQRKQAFEASALRFLDRRPEPPIARRFGGRALGLALTGVAIAAGLALLLRGPRSAPEPELAARSKGSSSIGFFVRRGEQVFVGANGEHLRAGDQLRFTVTSAQPRQFAVLSRDARGAASVYYPSGPRSRPLIPAQQMPLDTAVELDGTLGSETLFGVFCDQEFEVEPLRVALERSGKLPSLQGCSVDQLEVRKEAR